MHNKGVLDLDWEGPYKIVEVLRSGVYKLAYLNGELISRSWNANHFRGYFQ